MMMKTWIVVLIACLLSSAAVAQTGSSKTATAINTEINSTLASGQSPPISASSLRQVVLDIVATSYSLLDVANPSAPTLTITGATALTTSQPVLSMTQTWVTAGTTYTGMLLNVTNTASVVTSLLMDLQVGGASKFNVDETGIATAASHLIATNNVYAGSGAAFVFTTRTFIQSPSDGTLIFWNNAASRDTILAVGTAVPVITSCGTSPTIDAASTALAGLVTMGTTATGCVITFATAYSNVPYCVVTSQSQLTSFSYTVTASAITTVQTSTSNNKLNYLCIAH